MKIVIDTIPHKEQRYETVGDWWWEKDTLQIRVSEIGDWRKEMSIAYHEMREALLCKHLGITQEEVDAFDIDYENKRKEGDVSEPGNDPKAPYFLPHQYATRDERLLIADFGIDWKEYDDNVNSL